MAEVKIALKNENDMLFIPSAGIYLNFEEPGPIIVDTDKLSLQDRNTLRISLVVGKIVADKGEVLSEGLQSSQTSSGGMENAANRVLSAPIYERKETPLEAFENKERERQREFVALLKKKVSDVKKSVEKMKDLRDIKSLLELEKRGKKRKSMVSFLGGKVREFEKNITKSIEPVEGREMPKRYKIGTNFDVTEEAEEEEEVTIHFE